jgi:outer membrane lipoprotein LolB
MKKWVISAFVLALSGCASVPLSPVAEHIWQAQRQKLGTLTQWQLNAALVANSHDDGFDARLHWLQEDDSYRLRLHGPLGQGTVLIDGSSSGVRMRTGDSREYHAHDPETLLAQLTDLALPISHLKYWIRGLPAPVGHIQRQNFHANGSLALLEQEGWLLNFSQHYEQEGYILPRRIELKNEEFLIRLVISTWRF